jgi:hypothetical protein
VCLAKIKIQLTGVTGADGENDLTDVDTGDGTVWLTPGTTHTSLQSIGTSARQHLVDTDNVVWVGTDTKVETFLTGNLDEVPEVTCQLYAHSIWRDRGCCMKR